MSETRYAAPGARLASHRDGMFVTRVALTDYKSIARCTVDLGPLTFLIGPNGAGKSNFLDALSFIAEALSSTLKQALGDRGGIDLVRRRSGRSAAHFAIRLEFIVNRATTGHYAVRVGVHGRGDYRVEEEKCWIDYGDGRTPPAHFHVRTGEMIMCDLAMPPVAGADRLYLVTASHLPEFLPSYELLSRMSFYNISPTAIREPRDAGELLGHDGANLVSVIDRLSSDAPESKSRIIEYLAKVVPGVCGVDAEVIGGRRTLVLYQQVAGARRPRRFFASQMSDGTLRALGVLTALFQPDAPRGWPIPLIGIEEPEVALHPAASWVLLDGLREASDRRQILITSQSPDLLDDKEIPTDALRAVASEGGVTRIGELDDVGRSLLRDHLYTPGELLRQDLAKPDPAKIPVSAGAVRLFDGTAP